MSRSKSYSGPYKPKNPSKYRGDPSGIVFRSLLERAFMVYCDTNPSIIAWASEEKEFIIPYFSPVDGKMHRYFPDFLIEYVNKNKEIKKSLIEVKPKSQTTMPEKKKKKNKTFIYEMETYMVNSAKWEAAQLWCAKNGADFKILTEDHIKGAYGKKK